MQVLQRGFPRAGQPRRMCIGTAGLKGRGHDEASDDTHELNPLSLGSPQISFSRRYQANHRKLWDAKPEAAGRYSVLCSFGCNRQTVGNGGTAKPEAKERRAALRSFGYRILCIRTILQRKEELYEDL